jgi:hypothetical protein
MSDARALSYHDVVLRHADVDLLRGPDWLNDQVSTVAARSPQQQQQQAGICPESVQRCSL